MATASESQDQTNNTKTSLSLGAFATSALAVLALIGIIMTLAGFGIALAVETEFGIPHASIFKSSFDLLALSVWFGTWIVINWGDLLEQLFFQSSFLKMAGFASLLTFIGGTAACVYVWLRKKGLRIKLPQIKSILRNQTESRIFFLVTCITSAAVGLFILFMGPFFLIAVLFVTILFGTIPAISHSAGVSHIQKYVIQPKVCFPLLNAEQRVALLGRKIEKKTVSGANCVKILDGEKVVAQGRVVFSTAELIVLYQPNTGKVLRESIAGRSIEVISTLANY